MKRIAITVLCVLLLTTGAIAVMAAPSANSPSPVRQFDVAIEGGGAGKLSINTQTQKYVFNGKGFDPYKTYYLWYRIGNLPGIHTFASVTTRSGNVHLEGAWTTDLTSTPGALTFSVGTTAPLVVTLHTTSATDGTLIRTSFSAVITSGSPVRYNLFRVDTSSVLYNGPDQSLGGASVFWSRSDKTYPAVTLTAYDSAGNTCTSSWTPT